MATWWAVSDAESRAWFKDETPTGSLERYLWFKCAGPDDENVTEVGLGPDGQDWMVDYARDLAESGIGASLIARKLGGMAGGYYAVED